MYTDQGQSYNSEIICKLFTGRYLNIQAALMKITFVIEEWSQSTKGGRSTFMRQMAIVLSKLENVEICILIPCASPEDREDAQKYNIKVFEAKKNPGFEPVDCLLFPPEGFSSDYIICYGIRPGRCGQVLKDTNGCKWVHVVLRNAEETAWYQKTSVAIFKGQEQHETEVELCKNADMVITVGSQLEESFISALRQCKKDHIFNLTPGIFDESFFEQKQHRNSKNFEILVFGRGNAEDFEHDGLHVAAKAVAQLNKHEPSYILKVVGAPKGEQEKLTERLEGLEIPRGHLIVKSFDEERTKLGQLFSKVDLVLMPSGTGAFGLTALEALSAGVPILITHNSGLAEALREVPLGKGCIVHVGQTVGQAAEAAEWADQIKQVKKHRKTILEGARMLRNNYKEKYSWMDQCAAFVKKLRALHSG